VRLIRYLQAHCDIDTNRITAHNQVTGRTCCPGRRFDLAALKAEVDSPTYAADW
jgi:hypothetical protein